MYVCFVKFLGHTHPQIFTLPKNFVITDLKKFFLPIQFVGIFQSVHIQNFITKNKY